MSDYGLLAIICTLAARSQKEASSIRDRVLSRLDRNDQMKVMEALKTMEILGLVESDVFTIPRESNLVHVRPGSFANCSIDKLADFGIKMLALDSETAIVECHSLSLAILRAHEVGRALLSEETHMILDECFFEIFGSTSLLMGKRDDTVSRDDGEKGLWGCFVLLCFCLLLFLGTGVLLGYVLTA